MAHGDNQAIVTFDIVKNAYKITVVDKAGDELDRVYATGAYDPSLNDLVDQYHCGTAMIHGKLFFFNVDPEPDIEPEDEEPDYGQDGPCNGYVNRATWNVVLWLFNDEETYHWLRVINRFINSPDDAQKWIREFWGDGVTPDGVRLTYVNWKQIYDAILEDRS